MTGSTEEHRVDESSLMPGPTAYHPPLQRLKTDRLGVQVGAGDLYASLDAEVHAHGNSPVSYALIVLAAAGISALSVVLCRWWPAPGWVTMTVGLVMFVAVSGGGLWHISNNTPGSDSQPKRLSRRTRRTARNPQALSEETSR